MFLGLTNARHEILHFLESETIEWRIDMKLSVLGVQWSSTEQLQCLGHTVYKTIEVLLSLIEQLTWTALVSDMVSNYISVWIVLTVQVIVSPRLPSCLVWPWRHVYTSTVVWQNRRSSCAMTDSCCNWRRSPKLKFFKVALSKFELFWGDASFPLTTDRALSST